MRGNQRRVGSGSAEFLEVVASLRANGTRTVRFARAMVDKCDRHATTAYLAAIAAKRVGDESAELEHMGTVRRWCEAQAEAERLLADEVERARLLRLVAREALSPRGNVARSRSRCSRRSRERRSTRSCARSGDSGDDGGGEPAPPRAHRRGCLSGVGGAS